MAFQLKSKCSSSELVVDLSMPDFSSRHRRLLCRVESGNTGWSDHVLVHEGLHLRFPIREEVTSLKRFYVGSSNSRGKTGILMTKIGRRTPIDVSLILGNEVT